MNTTAKCFWRVGKCIFHIANNDFSRSIPARVYNKIFLFAKVVNAPGFFFFFLIFVASCDILL